MEIRTGVVSGEALEKISKKTIKSVRLRFDKMIAGRHFFCFNNTTEECQPIDIVRWLSELDSGEQGALALRNLLLNAIVTSENKQSSSGLICAETLLVMLEELFKSQHVKSFSVEEIEKDLEVLSNLSKRSTTKQIENIIDSNNRDSKSKCIARQAISLAGADGTLHIHNDPGPKTLIHKTFGYNFPIEVPEVFQSSGKFVGEKKYYKPKIVVIDGIIEKMSEINGLIHSSYTSKCPLIIVARGFSPDVENTLGVNFHSGNLSVIPIRVPYDLFGANLLNDVCSTVGSDIVSSLKGDIISAVLWEDLPTIDSIKLDCQASQMSISNKKTWKNVLIQKRNLQKKKLEVASHLTEQSDLLDKRILCLMGTGVEIKLGSDLNDSWAITKDRVESQVKMFRDASRFGIITLNEAKEKVRSPVTKKILCRVSRRHDIVISRALLLGIHIALNSAKVISNVGGIVYID